MNTIKALWLCSWYPDWMRPQNGDFIQRQALAASLFAAVTTIHVSPCAPSKLAGKRSTIESRATGSLKENIIYYEKKNEKLTSRIISLWRYLTFYKKWLDNYIAQNGKPDIVHLNIVMRDGLMARYLKIKYKIPYIITEHATIYQNTGNNGFRHFSWIRKWITKKIFKNAAEVLPVSTQLGECLKKLFGINYQVIPNVVDTTLFVRQITKHFSQPFTFIHISDASEKKNVPGIIAAFKDFYARYPLSKFIILGGNPAYQTLDNAVGHPGIELIQNVSYSAVAHILSNAQVCIVNSFYETFSCVIIESLACGVPVISTDIGVAPDIVDGNNGILIAHTDESLLAAMEKIYNNYPFYLSNQKPDAIHKQFSYKKIGADINAVYSDILKK